jgi:hypothetical protein
VLRFRCHHQGSVGRSVRLRRRWPRPGPSTEWWTWRGSRKDAGAADRRKLCFLTSLLCQVQRSDQSSHGTPNHSCMSKSPADAHHAGTAPGVQQGCPMKRAIVHCGEAGDSSEHAELRLETRAGGAYPARLAAITEWDAAVGATAPPRERDRRAPARCCQPRESQRHATPRRVRRKWGWRLAGAWWPATPRARAATA